MASLYQVWQFIVVSNTNDVPNLKQSLLKVFKPIHISIDCVSLCLVLINVKCCENVSEWNIWTALAFIKYHEQIRQ